MFTKKKKKAREIFKKMTSACSVLQSLLSSVVNMFQITSTSKKIKNRKLHHCRM